MEKNSIISVDGLMQLPDIDGLVQEVKGHQFLLIFFPVQTSTWRVFRNTYHSVPRRTCDEHLRKVPNVHQECDRTSFWQ